MTDEDNLRIMLKIEMKLALDEFKNLIKRFLKELKRFTQRLI